MPRDANGQLSPSRGFHRLDGIPDQVERDLLDLDLVNDDIGKVTLAPERYPHALLSRPDQSKRRGFLEQGGRVFNRVLGLSLRHKFAQALDDVAGAERLV